MKPYRSFEDRFSRLKQGSIIVVEYEAYFYELARRGTSILDTEYVRVNCFIKV